MIDYNLCRFNLVMETQPLTDYQSNLSNFCTEKTVKTLVASTPSYVIMPEDVYNQLKTYGFYFLNEEFGDYNFNNYIKFCEFLEYSNQNNFDELYNKSIIKSSKNKSKLEEYIYSDKTFEISLLLNKN